MKGDNLKTTIFVPKKIKVGFQNRSDTYTQKLAYVIYYDQKNALRKEASWQSWRDDKIEPEDYENVPMSGFVLNKKVGGYDTGWNHRQTYVRVYDPRNFEFEISVPNLLYILENTNSIKGKGIEGEFVYGWDGTDLVLVPTSSPDYVETEKYNEVVFNKDYVKVKDLKIGATYRSNVNKQLIYIGRFDYYEWDGTNKGKYFYFIDPDEKYYSRIIMKSISGRLISIINEECVGNYADLLDEIERSRDYSPHDPTKDEYVPYTLDEFEYKIKNSYWCISIISGLNNNCKIEALKKDTKLTVDSGRGYWDRKETEYTVEEFFNKYRPVYIVKYLKNGKLYLKEK